MMEDERLERAYVWTGIVYHVVAAGALVFGVLAWVFIR